MMIPSTNKTMSMENPILSHRGKAGSGVRAKVRSLSSCLFYYIDGKVLRGLGEFSEFDDLDYTKLIGSSATTVRDKVFLPSSNLLLTTGTSKDSLQGSTSRDDDFDVDF
jgi:hypothetical protein